MLDLDVLACGRELTLSLEAERVCLRRLAEIERRADPKDGPLHSLLRQVEANEREHLQEVAQYAADLDGQGLVDPELVATEFPSIRERLGESPLDREAALYYVESIKEEAFRFFRRLSDAVTDADVRALLRRIALGEIGEVARLREVVL